MTAANAIHRKRPPAGSLARIGTVLPPMAIRLGFKLPKQPFAVHDHLVATLPLVVSALGPVVFRVTHAEAHAWCRTSKSRHPGRS